MRQRSSPKAASLLLKILILVSYGAVLLRTAWTSDDAFITLRVVDNLINGYGLVWNTDERVQAYTHPLWMLLIALFYFFTREPYFTVLGLSAALSILSVAVLLRMCGNDLWRVALIGITLIGSKAFVDFSTSGLENPLSHFLLALLCFTYLRASPAKPHYWAALSGLLLLNRLDFVLFIVPLLLGHMRCAKSWAERWHALSLAVGPALVWMGFSTFYYGFPLPNTFYAKQYADIPRSEYFVRGIAYLYDFISNDPLSAVTIACGAVLGTIGFNRKMLWPFSLGTALYATYVFWIGGDFMRGRFFSAPFIVAVACLSQSLISNPVAALILGRILRAIGIGVALGLSLLARPVPTWLSGYPYPEAKLFRSVDTPLSRLVSKVIGRADFPMLLGHIIDERGFYYKETGLLPRLINGVPLEDSTFSRPARLLRLRGTEVAVHGAIGYVGFFSGPSVKIIDQAALSDALMARMPLRDRSEVWRIGHIFRYLPSGYVPSRMYGTNQIRNHEVKRLYDDIRLVTSGSLANLERFAAIARLNLSPVSIDPKLPYEPLQDATRYDFSAFLHPVPTQGLNIYMDTRRPISSSLLVVTSADAAYTLTFKFVGDTSPGFKVKEVLLPAVNTESPHKRKAHLVDLTQQPVKYNLLHLAPASGNQPSYAGQLRLLDSVAFLRFRQLVTAGITLSAAVGIAPDTPPPWVIPELAAGVWWSNAGVPTAIELVLSRVECLGSADEPVEVKVNGAHLVTHVWDRTRCSEEWSTLISVPSETVREGWNLLEVDVGRHLSVAIKRIWIKPAEDSQLPALNRPIGETSVSHLSGMTP